MHNNKNIFWKNGDPIWDVHLTQKSVEIGRHFVMVLFAPEVQ